MVCNTVTPISLGLDYLRKRCAWRYNCGFVMVVVNFSAVWQSLKLKWICIYSCKELVNEYTIYHGRMSTCTSVCLKF